MGGRDMFGAQYKLTVLFPRGASVYLHKKHYTDIKPKGWKYIHLDESDQQNSPGEFDRPDCTMFRSCV